ncbi:MAG: apolipoprotein N-acyltransferase, partial [Gammaproteobacteria bacterium]|nr:apolipoprotein N-acyltransferase [Gammaproteobacteria bacterium]
FMAATDQALKTNTQPVDFAMWPETAFPAILGEGLRPDKYRMALTDFLRQRNLTLLTGAYGVDLPSGRLTNSLFVVNPEGQVIEPHYSKTILLALGEYIPGEDWFPIIREWLPQTGLFARGQGPTTLLEWQGFKMGPQICYESLFPWFSRELSNRGAQFIVNVTNDSWYGDWQEPWQHMVMTLARGVEFRRPVLRVTNTGISTVGLASGDRIGESPVHEVWAGIFDVPYLQNPKETFYQKSPYLVQTVFWSALLVLILHGERRRRESAKT